MRILVANPFAAMRTVVKTTLKEMGLTNIVEVDNGSTALQVLKKKSIALVIADWDMPKMSGLDLLKAVREQDKSHETLFIMAVKDPSKEIIMSALSAGADDLVVIPFSPAVLSQKVEKKLGANLNGTGRFQAGFAESRIS